MDIDIDLNSSFDPLDYFPEAIRASMIKDNKLVKHPAGAYFQNIAKDNITNLAAIPYKEAEEAGYFKVDFLHLSFLDNFESKDEIKLLLRNEPNWDLLEDRSVVEKLSHVHKHFDLVNRIKPRSVQELADVLAMIRPSKRYLVDAYIKDRDVIRTEIFTKPENGGYYFKKPHAIAYSLNIVLQLHLIGGGII